MTLLIQSTSQVADPTLPVLKRDNGLLGDDAAGGVLFAFDAAFGWCYSAGSPVPDGAVVRDTSEHANAVWRIPGGAGQPVISGRGFDLSTATVENTFLEIPASVAQTIWSNQQRFLVALYVRLPIASDYNTATSDVPLLSWSTGNGYTVAPELLHVGMGTSSTVKQLHFRRQTAIGTTENRSFTVPEAALGGLAQIAAWRTAEGFTASIRTAAGRTTSATLAGGADNTSDFSGLTGKLGISAPYWSNPLTTAQIAAKNFRVYRGWVEALAVSGRVPLTVLDRDWTNTMARNVYA